MTPAFSPYIFFFNTDDEVIIMENDLPPWREEGGLEWQSLQQLVDGTGV